MKRPKISVNFAISADGKITSPERKPSGWTSEEDHSRLLKLRTEADALMVGRGTLEADNMTMRSTQNPLRCIISKKGVFNPDHPIFSADGGPIHLLGTGSMPEPIGNAFCHQSSLMDFLTMLHDKHGVRHVHCEGGGSLMKELADEDVVDDIHLTWAGHTLFGGSTTPTITGIPDNFLPSTRHYELVTFEPHPDLGECFLSYRRKR